MGGFNKNPNDQTSNPNINMSNVQQNQGSQNFMGALPNNPLMNFSMPGQQMNPGSFEGAEGYPYGVMGQSTLYQEHLKKLKDKFAELKDEIMKMDKNPDLFKNHQLPLARVKKIMKSDEDMISAEAPVLFAKACEIFIVELTHRAWFHTEESKRRTLQKTDIANCISHTDIFDFLLDIIPKEEYKATQPPRKSNEPFMNAFQQLAAGQNSNMLMGNKNVGAPNANANFNQMMGQNFLNMGNLLGQNQGNQQNQGQNIQPTPGQNNSSYPGFANFINQNSLPYVGIKEENKNSIGSNSQMMQKMNNNGNK